MFNLDNIDLKKEHSSLKEEVKALKSYVWQMVEELKFRLDDTNLYGEEEEADTSVTDGLTEDVETLYTRTKKLTTKTDEIEETLETIGSDYVVAYQEPTSSSLGYRLWASGYCEIFGNRNFSGAVSTAWGSLYYSGLTSANLPLTLSEVFQRQVNVRTGNAWAMPQNVTTNRVQFYLVSAASQSSLSTKVDIFVTGKVATTNTANELTTNEMETDEDIIWI